MVHVRLTNTLFLLIYLTLVIKCVDTQFCKRRMKYHNHTHSCMIVVNETRKHDEANAYCKQNFSGHLVYILDEETNTFTKSLLPGYDQYHIGLNDKKQNSVYRWENGEKTNYTDFGKQHVSSIAFEYVVMYKHYWIESYNYEYKFICQTNAEKEFFFLSGSNFINKTLIAKARYKVLWECGVLDRENHQLKLLYRKIDGTNLHLYNVHGADLKHEMTPDCNSSGVFICQITNTLNRKVVNLEGILKVQCDATNCSDKNSEIKLLVTEQSGYTEGKFCLFMYPNYTHESVHKVETTKVKVQKDKYSIDFTYTNEIYSKGELVIKFRNVTSSDYGGYVISLWNNANSLSTLYFNITEKAEEAQDGQPLDDNTVFYIIPIVALVVILVVTVVIIVLVKKRKKKNSKNAFTDQKGFQYNCGSETISTQHSSQNNDNFSANTLDPVCSTEVAENIYNNVLEHNAQQGAKVLKPARKSGSSVKLKDKVSMAAGKKQAATLPLGKTLVTWDDEKEDVNVYENAREDTTNQVQEFEDKEYNPTPSNEEKLPLQEPDGEASKRKEDSRTISPEGLVYVSVEINRSGPQIVVEKPKVEDKVDKKQTQDKKQKEIVKEVKPSYDPVEYSSLDYLATSVAATEDGVGGLDTEELKNV